MQTLLTFLLFAWRSRSLSRLSKKSIIELNVSSLSFSVISPSSNSIIKLHLYAFSNASLNKYSSFNLVGFAPGYCGKSIKVS